MTSSSFWIMLQRVVSGNKSPPLTSTLSTEALHYIYSRPLRIVTELDFQREGGATRIVFTKELDVETN